MSSPIPLIIAFVVAVLTSACDAQESTSVGTADPKLIEVRDRIVHRIESGELPSVSVAVARNGKVVWMESFGWQDIENRIPATPKTVYAIGSIAKSMTATGVMVQVDAGKLNLNQRIVEVIGRDALQSYGGSASQITLRDVLSMTAGIPHGWVSVRNDNLVPDLQQVLHDFAFVAFPPGEVFEYSNFSLGIAEYVLEESAGVSFPEYMKAEVFGPLGMHSTSMGAEPRANNSFAKRYSSDLESLQRTFFIPSGGGGAFSSAEDLLAFAMFHLGNPRSGQPEVLSDEALDQMHHDKSASQGATGSGPGWALGIGSVTLDDGTSWYVSNGSVGGGNAIVLMYPEENTAIVCLTNRTGTIADQIANEIANALIEDHPDKFAKAIEMWREDQPPSYETSEAMLGPWEGWLQSGELKLPVSFQFGDSGEIAVSIDGSDPVPVQNPRLGRGQFRGRLGVAVPNSIKPREIAGGLTDVKLVVGDGVMSGYMGTQFEMEQASYSIPVYVEVRKVR